MSSGHDAPAYEIAADDETVHSAWDNDLDPVRTIEPGDVVRFTCRDSTGGQFGPDSTVADVADLDVDRVHTLTGPVAIDGARTGDVLEIELLAVDHRGWGYTVVLPSEAELGLLADEFPDPSLYVWEFDGDVARFANDIAVPLDPFPGVLGVAPAEDGTHETFPPRSVGGNMDIKQLTAGSTLYLPVAVDDALFSVGDGHAAQGDGEVCGTGIEAPMDVTCRFDLRSDLSIDQPQFETSGPFTSSGRDEPMYGTTGIADDLQEAARDAVRQMIDHLETERGLERNEAYMLCSVAVDLKINEVVNAPNWVVSAYLPDGIFPEDRRGSA
ncbi:acetamidase/formamidase family protein [Natrinema longum]|uniref:Acetamidase/formamidase family protein n=1 Tax=Natrinema longum TaxID=370324 RepID=A0A8A2U698_9EURY|nr:acetamidase/formamidase family protein [Natrinema longum]MBZ6494906.1 acetamidase/formamidase family protein [Natrinema longum]QSW83795.1 acetamidase/formamidase family protein [Natrinema longum]